MKQKQSKKEILHKVNFTKVSIITVQTNEGDTKYCLQTEKPIQNDKKGLMLFDSEKSAEEWIKEFNTNATTDKYLLVNL